MTISKPTYIDGTIALLFNMIIWIDYIPIITKYIPITGLGLIIGLFWCLPVMGVYNNRKLKFVTGWSTMDTLSK